ncbi:hypothetical protein O181_124109 [Austropuccinia psidii MF-1]|uniref:Uncharacterized protein n=1 Tax=Austropuccinia psidii MF-1 TaxID=1389203 RepID=A0A9Q3KRF4_9BASI|nr:hypothetical protein [Austropuccinia psidii MF-1]
MPSTRSGANYSPLSNSQKGHRPEYGRSQSVSEKQGSVNESQTGKLCHSEAYNTVLPSNRADTTTRSLVTQWIPSIDGKGKNDAFNRRMGEKQPSNTQASAQNSFSSQKNQFKHEKAATSSEKRQRQSTSYKALQPGLQNPKDSAGCHGKCIPDGQNNDGTTEKGRS